MLDIFKKNEIMASRIKLYITIHIFWNFFYIGHIRLTYDTTTLKRLHGIEEEHLSEERILSKKNSSCFNLNH